jgi:chemotaxis methyl-accepting protein methylase
MGCSTGEEPYSIAILIQRHLKIRTKRFKIHIDAADIDTTALEFAKKGIYTRNRFGNLDPKIIRAFFVPVKDGYKVCGLIRRMVNFQHQDILKFKSLNTIFDLILCRNMLIYFSKKNHFQAYNYFSRHLSPGGYLVLGKAEIIIYTEKLEPLMFDKLSTLIKGTKL